MVGTTGALEGGTGSTFSLEHLEVIQGVQMNRAALTGGCCSHGWVTGLSAAGE